jgi:hypothetical protein
MTEQQQTLTQQTFVPINEINRYTMYADNNTGKKAKLCWCIRESSPRITVYTNNPLDTVSKGVINCPMNPETFFLFVDLFEQVLKGPNDKKYKINCFNGYNPETGTYDSQGPKNLVCELWFGKDEEGIAWISLIAPERPQIKFVFKLSDFHGVTKGNGDSFSVSELSVLQAQATIIPLKHIYYQHTGTFRNRDTTVKPTWNAGDNTNTLYGKITAPAPESSSIHDDDLPY